MKTSIKLFLMLCVTMAFGQEHKVEGQINTVKETGLYRIAVPQKVRSYAAKNMRDIRVLDAQGHQVPYFLQEAKAYKNIEVSDFTEFDIKSKTRIADSTATYIFKNPDKTIKQAVFLIANYQGSKRYKLEGSNNQKDWFGIVNSGQLDQLNHPKQTSVYKVINFPLCSYKYLKVVFIDCFSATQSNISEISYTNTFKAVAYLFHNLLNILL